MSSRISDIVDIRYANVFGIYGHLGGGKSMTAVEIMTRFLSLGFPVSSNIALKNIDSFRGSFNFVEDFSICDFWLLPCGAPRGVASKLRAAVVVDEAAELLNQFSSTSQFTLQFCSWLRQSSKRGQFVFLIVQRPEFLVKSARLLVNTWILCDDMAQWRMPVLGFPVPFLGGYVRRLAFDRVGNQISKGMCLGRKSDIARYYDTSQIFNLSGRVYNTVDYTEPPRDLTKFFLFILLLLAFVRLYLLGLIF